jgi:hypothetical protein
MRTSRELRAMAQKGRLTLVYAARDELHNEAVMLPLPMGWSRGRSSPTQPLRSLGSAICSNSVRIASFAVMRPILRFSLDCWKATGRPVSAIGGGFDLPPAGPKA